MGQFESGLPPYLRIVWPKRLSHMTFRNQRTYRLSVCPKWHNELVNPRPPQGQNRAIQALTAVSRIIPVRTSRVSRASPARGKTKNTDRQTCCSSTRCISPPGRAVGPKYHGISRHRAPCRQLCVHHQTYMTQSEKESEELEMERSKGKRKMKWGRRRRSDKEKTWKNICTGLHLWEIERRWTSVTTPNHQSKKLARDHKGVRLVMAMRNIPTAMLLN